jgi:hypothetical protein
MDMDTIAEIGIDDKGRLYVLPQTQAFPYIYREAMEVHWDITSRYLYAPPPPRAQLATPIWWCLQILAAAKEQGCVLHIAQETKWKNISPQLKEEILSSFGAAPALRDRSRVVPRSDSACVFTKRFFA